jgi:signal transduction histidine kinase
MGSAILPDLEALNARIAELESALAARTRTVEALTKRAQARQTGAQTAYGQIEASAGLQQVVARKTLELQKKNEELEGAYRHLQRAQEEAYQRQKLESIGRLAAGIAHEINTPVQFVSDSVHFVNEGVRDLLSTLRSLQATARSSGHVRADQLGEALLDADYDYLVEHLPKALDRSQDGLGRVAKLVRGMKEFAHPGQETMQPIDLNHAIDATLTVAQNQTKYVAEVVTEFGTLPPVTCLGGEVNQVVLNLLVNAAHAIEEKTGGKGERGRITVRTRVEGGDAIIEVSDSGAGMPPEVIQRVFEPFFTTKDVGRGTGQGLALAHTTIVVRHGGQISVESAVGVGTTIRVRLPLEGREAAPGRQVAW